MAFDFSNLIPVGAAGAAAGDAASKTVSAVQDAQLNQLKIRAMENQLANDELNQQMRERMMPEEIAFNRLKNAQSINSLPAKPTVEDFTQAQNELAPDKLELDETDHAKILARAQEIAESRQPKFDMNNPMTWLMAQQPTSKGEMDAAKQQIALETKLDILARQQAFQGYQQNANRENKITIQGMKNAQLGADGGDRVENRMINRESRALKTKMVKDWGPIKSAINSQRAYRDMFLSQYMNLKNYGNDEVTKSFEEEFRDVLEQLGALKPKTGKTQASNGTDNKGNQILLEDGRTGAAAAAKADISHPDIDIQGVKYKWDAAKNKYVKAK